MTDLKDSGSRQVFGTGSQRDTRDGKGRFDLLWQGLNRAMTRLAILLERGAAKYGARNWEKGQPLSRYLDSALRHLNAVARGAEDEDHAIQAAWNCLALVETLERVRAGELPPELNDVYRLLRDAGELWGIPVVREVPGPSPYGPVPYTGPMPVDIRWTGTCPACASPRAAGSFNVDGAIACTNHDGRHYVAPDGTELAPKRPWFSSSVDQARDAFATWKKERGLS